MLERLSCVGLETVIIIIFELILSIFNKSYSTKAIAALIIVNALNVPFTIFYIIPIFAFTFAQGSEELAIAATSLVAVTIIISIYNIILVLIRSFVREVEIKGSTKYKEKVGLEIFKEDGNVPSTMELVTRGIIRDLLIITLPILALPIYGKYRRGVHEILTKTGVITQEGRE